MYIFSRDFDIILNYYTLLDSWQYVYVLKYIFNVAVIVAEYLSICKKLFLWLFYYSKK